MILDFIRKKKNIFFLAYLIIAYTTLTLQNFNLFYFYLLGGSILFFAITMYFYCKYIVNSNTSLNFEICLIISNLILVSDFIQLIRDYGNNKTSGEIIMIVLGDCIFTILYSEKFNISGRLFK